MNAERVIRIGYDSQGFQQRIGGVSRYFCEMIRRLPTDISWELPFSATPNEYLTKTPYLKELTRICADGFLSSVPKCVRTLLLPRTKEDHDCQIRKMVNSSRFDLLHLTGPHWLGPGWRQVLGRIPYVVTIHDLIPDIIGGQEGAVSERKEVLENAAHIIAVSMCTKKDLVRLYGIAPEKVTVVYHGRDDAERSPCRAVPGVQPGRYVLYVGSRAGYKNWRFLVRAMADVLKRHDLNLICTGTDLGKEEKSLLKDLGILERVRCLFCEDDELSWLYANAHCFVYPSKYEGFGLPILEAFVRKCPVVLSHCSCFPEIAEDAALYFDDGNEAQLKNHIESLFDERLRSELTARGVARSRDFTWERCAQETAGVYRGVMIT